MASVLQHASPHPTWSITFSRIISTRLLISFIVMIALFFRLQGIGFGLPYIYGFGELAVVQSGYQLHRAGFGTDEPQIVNAALRILANRTLNPDYFDYPGTPLIYMGAILYMGIFAFGMLVGAFKGTDDFVATYIHNPSLFYLTGRLLVVFLSLLTVILIYLIGKRIFNRTVALMAAGIVAVSPIEIYLSKLFRVDILMGLFILIAFWFCLEILRKRSWWSYILAGLFTGFATVTKYPGILFAITILLTHIATRPQKRDDHLKLVAAGFATLIGAFIGSPYAFLDYQSVLVSLRDEASPHLGGPGQGLILNLIWYVRESLPLALSAAGLVLTGIGAVLSIAAREKTKLLLLSFPVVYVVFISLLNPRWERWIMPIIPFAALLIAYAMYELYQWVGKRTRPQVGTAATLLLGIVIVIPLVQLNLLDGRILFGEDTRTSAGEWMVENIPTGSRVLMELNTPQTPVNQFKYYLVETDSIVPLDLSKERHDFVLVQGRMGWLQDIDEVAQNQIDYLVMSDYYERYSEESQTYPHEVSMYEKLMGLGRLVYEIFPKAGENEGPHIRIYQLSPG